MNRFIYYGPPSIGSKRLKKWFLPLGLYSLATRKKDWITADLLDNYDGELIKKSKFLFQTEDSLILVDLITGEFSEQRAKPGWLFVNKLQAGEVFGQLKSISILRALLPVATFRMRQENGSLLDDEQKTTARFSAINLQNDKARAVIGATKALRGYQDEHDILVQGLLDCGGFLYKKPKQLQSLLGLRASGYSGKPKVLINPDQDVLQTALKIIRTYLGVARQNEGGVQKDIDTEFLHDYRVSFRKIRSVISLFRGVFTDQDRDWLKTEFSSIMQRTNMLRDLDVYLLEKDAYFSLIPPSSHDGLELLFNYFREQRKREHKKIYSTLGSKKYQKQIRKLEEFFRSTNGKIVPGRHGTRNTLEYGSELILKRYRKVCKIARSIDETTKDEVVHELRINCKKLRYLMEFFSPLFDKQNIKTLISSLKLLQDNLGHFNDYSVQQLFLRRLFEDDVTVCKGKEMQVAESIGALTAMLNRKQLKERGLVMSNFAKFDSQETRQMFQALFASTGGK